MAKGTDAFRSIGEVADLIGVAPHVLRYWETQFSALKPMKRPDGRRYYRPADVELAAGICVLLRQDGLTIRGAIKQIASDRGYTVRLRGSALLDAPAPNPQGAIDQPKPTATQKSVAQFSDGPWLNRLVQLTRKLQRLDPAERHWSELRSIAQQLAQAMLRLT